MTKAIPALLLLVLMGMAYLLGLHKYLTLEALKAHRSILMAFVNDHARLAPFIFILVYYSATALSVPGALILTILAGFLFPQPLATFYVVMGATLGAATIFLIAKTALGAPLRKTIGKYMPQLEQGFQKNAANYLLFLRFVPIFPFWLVNLAPAFFEIPFRTFLWTTFVGIIPGSFAFTQLGSGLGSILDSGKALSLSSALTTEVKIALLALGVFALLPILIKNIWTPL